VKQPGAPQIEIATQKEYASITTAMEHTLGI